MCAGTACNVYRIQTQADSKPWPTNQQLAFYNNYINGTEREQDFVDTYAPLVSLYQQGQYQEVIDALKSLSQIEDNFLQLSVTYEQDLHMSVLDQPKYTVADVFSQFGGTFNLYAGISAVIIFELVKLVADLLILLMYISLCIYDTIMTSLADKQHGCFVS